MSSTPLDRPTRLLYNRIMLSNFRLDISDEERRQIVETLQRLDKSKFRHSFHLRKADLDYIDQQGWLRIQQHAVNFIAQRIAKANIPNDGKQTPMRRHPVFIAQHATATCCRGCMHKWYKIKKGRALTDDEQRRIVNLIMAWIVQQYTTRYELYYPADQIAEQPAAKAKIAKTSRRINTAAKINTGKATRE